MGGFRCGSQAFTIAIVLSLGPLCPLAHVVGQGNCDAECRQRDQWGYVNGTTSTWRTSNVVDCLYCAFGGRCLQSEIPVGSCQSTDFGVFFTVRSSGTTSCNFTPFNTFVEATVTGTTTTSFLTDNYLCQ